MSELNGYLRSNPREGVDEKKFYLWHDVCSLNIPMKILKTTTQSTAAGYASIGNQVVVKHEMGELMKRNVIVIVVLIISLMSLIACMGYETEEEFQLGQKELVLSEEARFMAFLNDAGTTVELLDTDCGIRSDSAKKIVQYRDGKDKIFGTPDDNLIDSEAELLEISMVGPWTRDQLFECAIAFGWLDEEEALPNETLSIIRDLAAVDPELVAVINNLIVDATEYYADHEIIFPVKFVELEKYTVNGTPTRYVVRLAQWLDPECGVLLWMEYELDANFNVVDVYVYI